MHGASHFKAALLVENLGIGSAHWHCLVELHLAVTVSGVMFMTVTVFECDTITSLNGNGLRIEPILLLINRMLGSGGGSGNSNS